MAVIHIPYITVSNFHWLIVWLSCSDFKVSPIALLPPVHLDKQTHYNGAAFCSKPQAPLLLPSRNSWSAWATKQQMADINRGLKMQQGDDRRTQSAGLRLHTTISHPSSLDTYIIVW